MITDVLDGKLARYRLRTLSARKSVVVIERSSLLQVYVVRVPSTQGLKAEPEVVALTLAETEKSCWRTENARRVHPRREPWLEAASVAMSAPSPRSSRPMAGAEAAQTTLGPPVIERGVCLIGATTARSFKQTARVDTAHPTRGDETVVIVPALPTLVAPGKSCL